MPSTEQIALLSSLSKIKRDEDDDNSSASQLSVPVSEVSTVKPECDDASNHSSITDEEEERFEDEGVSPQNDDNKNKRLQSPAPVADHPYPPTRSKEIERQPLVVKPKEVKEPKQQPQPQGEVPASASRRSKRTNSRNSNSDHSHEEFAMDFGHSNGGDEEIEKVNDDEEVRDELQEGNEDLEPGSAEWCFIWEQKYEQWKQEHKKEYKEVEKEMKRLECERVELERVRRLAENKESAHATRIMQIFGVGLCFLGILVVVIIILLAVVYNGNNNEPAEEDALSVNIHESGETAAPYDPPPLDSTNETFSPIVWPLPTLPPVTMPLATSGNGSAADTPLPLPPSRHLVGASSRGRPPLN